MSNPISNQADLNSALLKAVDLSITFRVPT